MRSDVPATTAPFLVTEFEAARLLKISQRKMWQLAADGKIPTVHLGREKRYDVADLRELIERMKASAR